MSNRIYSATGLVIFLFTFLLLIHQVPAKADSAYVDIAIPGTTRDIGTGEIYLEGGFTVNNGTGHYWAGQNYYTVDIATGAITSIGSPDSLMSNGAGDPFGMYDPISNAFYAATYADTGSSYVYKYDYSTGTWSDGYSAVNIYGGDFSGDSLYISGLRQPWSGGYDNTFISLFDFSGNGNHDALIEVGGASSYMAADSKGNIYYAPYSFTGTVLYMWTAEQIAGVTNDYYAGEEDTYLSLEDGQIISTLKGTSNGITVDDADNVFVSLNGFDLYTGGSAVVMWDGTISEEENYNIVATSVEGTYGWFGPLTVDGDFTEGGSLYGSFGWLNPITEITPEVSAVPVPGAVWFLGSGMLALAGLRKRSSKG